MLTSETLQKAMSSHHQKLGMSCVASAFEFVAKLHALIPPKAFPLQSYPENQEQSFADCKFLIAQGLKCQNNLYNIEEVFPILEKETNGGKFPLIALLPLKKMIPPYHIYCAIQRNNQLFLVDPAVPEIVVNNKEDLTTAILQNSQVNPERKTIDIF